MIENHIKKIALVMIPLCLISSIGGKYLLNTYKVGCDKSMSITELADRGEPLLVEYKIKKEDKKDTTTSDKNINELVYSMYVMTDEVNYQLKSYHDELEIAKEKGFSIDDSESYIRISKKSLKSLLNEANENHIKFKEVENQYIAYADLQYILDTYGSRIGEDLKNIISFANEDNIKSTYTASTGTFDMDLICQRLNIIENELKRENHPYYNQWLSYEEYYKDALFGRSHALYVDENNKFKQSILDKYNEIIKNSQDQEYAKELEEYLQVLSDNDNTMNQNVSSYLDTIFKKYTSLAQSLASDSMSPDVNINNGTSSDVSISVEPQN